MKTSYIFLAFIGILLYNVVLIKRDQEMFKAYDSKCAELPSHSRCHLAK